MSIDYTSYRNAAKNIPDVIWQEAITERPKWEQKGIIPPEFDNDVWATEYYHFKTGQFGFFTKSVIAIGVGLGIFWIIDLLAQLLQIGFLLNISDTLASAIALGIVIGIWFVVHDHPKDKFKERLAAHVSNLRNAPSPAPAQQSPPQGGAFDVPPQDE